MSILVNEKGLCISNCYENWENMDYDHIANCLTASPKQSDSIHAACWELSLAHGVLQIMGGHCLGECLVTWAETMP